MCCNTRNILQRPATHCNTLQHTAAHYNTLQHTATHCESLQHTATLCNTLQHTAVLTHLYRNIKWHRGSAAGDEAAYVAVWWWYVHIWMCMYICIYLHIHPHIYIYIYMYTFTMYICTYIYIYICIYTHTYTHSYKCITSHDIFWNLVVTHIGLFERITHLVQLSFNTFLLTFFVMQRKRGWQCSSTCCRMTFCEILLLHI